jgi:hypothetical protein
MTMMTAPMAGVSRHGTRFRATLVGRGVMPVFDWDKPAPVLPFPACEALSVRVVRARHADVQWWD